MKYYSYAVYDPDNPKSDPETKGYIVTLSEKEIIDQYWDYWYGRMCKKFGKEHVDANYTQQDCIYDFCVIHWCWESE